MDNETEKQIEGMLKKAAESDDAGDALKFTQAALNAAHAVQVLKSWNTSEIPSVG